MQYFRWSHTNMYSRRIITSDWLAMLCLIYSKMWLAALAANAHYWLMLSLPLTSFLLCWSPATCLPHHSYVRYYSIPGAEPSILFNCQCSKLPKFLWRPAFLQRINSISAVALYWRLDKLHQTTLSLLMIKTKTKTKQKTGKKMWLKKAQELS